MHRLGKPMLRCFFLCNLYFVRAIFFFFLANMHKKFFVNDYCIDKTFVP